MKLNVLYLPTCIIGKEIFQHIKTITYRQSKLFLKMLEGVLIHENKGIIYPFSQSIA